MQTAQPRYELLRGEEIVLEQDRIVLTNMRLIGNFDSAGEEGPDAPELREVGAPNKFNGGRVSRRQLAYALMFGGLAILALQVLLFSRFTEFIGVEQQITIVEVDGEREIISNAAYDWWSRIDAVIFLLGSASAMVGLYLLLNGLFRPSPNTTVIFPVLEGRDIIASYPEWDNPQAEELVRAFARTKRGIGR